MACLLELNDESVKETSEERFPEAKIAQLGERMTEDHKVRCSIHLLGAFFFFAAVAESKAVLLRFHEVDSPIEIFKSVNS